jgi:hypothetical protein
MTEPSEEKREIPDEFTKIIKDFVLDIVNTFPEYQPIIDKWWKPQEFKDIVDPESRNAAILTDAQQKLKGLFDHCIRVFPERFFDILYKKTEIFASDSQVNTEFLPGISFKYLWQCDISDNTRETIWKYLQMVLICIIGSVHNKDAFGDTSKLFDAINEDEFKGKLEETLGNMQNIFENMGKDNNGESSGDDSAPNVNIPSADDIQGHLNSMMGGKLGNLAREIAEETSQNLNMDMDDVTDVKGVIQKLFSNPGKLMGLVKNVSEKLDSRMKSGEISQTELMTEASEMMNKMQNMPGMGNIQEMLGKMGMGGAGGMGNIQEMLGKMGMGGAGGMGDLAAMAGMAGLGKNAKLDVNAMQQKMEKNAKHEALKGRMKKKVEAKHMEELVQTAKAAAAAAAAQSAPTITDEELFALFKTGDTVERTPRNAKPNDGAGKKKKKPKK